MLYSYPALILKPNPIRIAIGTTSEIRNFNYAAFEIYFTRLRLATGNKVCSSGKVISLCT